jgi:flagellar hook-length control protein FliK
LICFVYYVCKRKVSSGSTTRDTDGLDRKEGLKYGGRTVVNPLLFANSSSISLSALSGGNSAVSSSNNPDTTNNFNNIINSLLSGSASAENQTQTSATASNQQIKSALYQAVAMLYITGGISSVASQDTASIAKNPVVSTVIQNNNLTPAQIQIFLTTLKSAAMSIVSDPSIFAAPEKGSADTFLSLIQNGNNNNSAPLNTSYQKSPAESVNENNCQADNSLNDNSQLPTAVVSQQALNQDSTVENTVQTADAADNSPAPALNVDDSQPMIFAAQTADAVNGITTQLGKLQELANAAENVLSVKTAGTNNSAAANNTTENTGTTALAGMIKELNNDIAGALKALTSISSGDSTQSASKALSNVKNLMDDAASTLNSIMASAAALQMIPQSLAVPVAVVSSNDISIANQPSNGNNQTAAMLSYSGNGNSNQGGNTGIATSNQPELNDLASRITALLREMNGKLEVISKYEYTAADNNSKTDGAVLNTDAQILAPVNNAVTGSGVSFKNQPDENAQTAGADIQLPPQQPASQPALNKPVTQGNNDINNSAAVLSDNETVAPEITAPINFKMASDDKASSAIIREQDVAQSVLDNTILTPATPLTQDAAVTAAAQLLNNDSIKYQPGNSAKNLIRDINWLADNIVRPALTVDASITSTLTSNAAAAPSFTNMAAFAKSAMDQVVLKQVVMNLNNSQPVKVDEIRMTLRPENLGTVIVKIDHSNNEIKGSFIVSNNDVKDALKAGLPDLKNTLNNLGIRTDSISVTVSDSNAGAYDRGSNGQFNEWEGAVAPSVINDFNGNVDAYFGVDGSFNYLA